MSPIVWRVEHFAEIDSTNTYLLDQVRDDLAEGLVALADFQSSGRGRLDRAWVSPPRASLLCSILLRPNLDATQLQLVVAIVALATRSALERLCGLRPQLKWPNDLVVGQHKLAGLLAEVVKTTSGFAVVVGLGVNLTYEGPEDVAATSVRGETGVTIAPRALLDIVLEEIEARCSRLDSKEGRVALRDEYTRALATIGQYVRVEQLDGSCSGFARGVDESGQLLVEVDGAVRAFGAGDVVHVRPRGAVQR
ncbi:MAG TPA: biotin--[acetyl-CoA-carboxylase] ligase [Acidimicrobiales bacterium]|nr:biotin--[acetyl-CoA-carboxylase] ligase [Acidimicrobiales bacterium]